MGVFILYCKETCSNVSNNLTSGLVFVRYYETPYQSSNLQETKYEHVTHAVQQTGLYYLYFFLTPHQTDVRQVAIFITAYL